MAVVGGAAGLSLYNEQTTNKQKVMTADKGKEIYINTTGTNLDLLLTLVCNDSIHQALFIISEHIGCFRFG